MKNFFTCNILNLALESYIWWSVVSAAAPHSSEKLRDIWDIYINKLRNRWDIEIAESKSLQCASAVNELMGMHNDMMMFLSLL